MTNPMINPQPNYSGVTIQISNPAVYTGQNAQQPCKNRDCCCNQGYITYPQGSYPVNNQYPPQISAGNINETNQAANPSQNTGYQNAYPAPYYLNNYTINNERKNDGVNNTDKLPENDSINTSEESLNDITPNSYKMYAENNEQKDNDMTKSKNIIEDLNERETEQAEEKKNTKETKIVALTDEYIKSLENYLDNPNDEIRLMASKEILTRLDEDKDRYDDAALNALLNKMMQDPNKLVRISALSAFSSQLASGNDYTVKLLQDIQSNPNSDKEDVLQAADILLKMSAGTEVKNIPNPSVKENTQEQK